VQARIVPAQNSHQFLQDRETLRQAVKDTMELMQVKMAISFDANHQPPQLEGRAYIRLVRRGKRGYSVPQSSKLSPIVLGPFPIKRRVGELAYELDLPPHLKIHPVISVIHLEQAYDDEYGRTIPPPPPLIIDGQEEHEIERIMEQKEHTARLSGDMMKQRHGNPLQTCERMYRNFSNRFSRNSSRKERGAEPILSTRRGLSLHVFLFYHYPKSACHSHLVRVFLTSIHGL